jgi:hypothetical protein
LAPVNRKKSSKNVTMGRKCSSDGDTNAKRISQFVQRPLGRKRINKEDNKHVNLTLREKVVRKKTELDGVKVRFSSGQCRTAGAY